MARKIVEVELKAVGADKAVQEINEVTQSLNQLEKQEQKNTQETESLTDSVTTNGGAMGILNELTGGMAQRFKDAYEALALTNKGLTGMKGALLATGIGAAVIAVGYLVTNFREVQIALGFINPQMEKLNETMDEANIAAQDASRGLQTLQNIILDTTRSEEVRESALRELSKTVVELNDVSLDQVDALDQVVKKTGPYIVAVQARAKADAFAKLIAEEQANLIRKRAQAERDLTDSIDNQWKISTKVNEWMTTSANNTYQKRLEQLDEEENFIINLGTEYENLLADAVSAESAISSTNTTRTNTVKENTEAVKSVQKLTLAQQEFARNMFFMPGVGWVDKETFQTLKDRAAQAKADKKQEDEDAKTAEQNAADAVIARDERIAEMKIDIEQRVLDAKRKAVDLAIGLFGAETAAGKAALIAKQIMAAKEMIDQARKTITFSSLAAAESSAAVAEGTAKTAKIGFPQNIPMLIAYALQAAGIVSAMSSALRKSKSVASSVGAGGGGGGVDPVPAIATPAVSTESFLPQFSTVGASGVNQLADVLGGQSPVRAFVVSGDVSTAQQLDRNIIQSASLG